VVLSGRNAKRVLFGALNLASGRRHFMLRERGWGEDFRAFLWHVHVRYRGWHVAMLLDEDPSHTAGDSVAMAHELGIEELWLPKRAPELNPMDHLWREPKSVICANRQYDTIEEEGDRFVTYLEALSPHQARLRAGLLSPTFWLK
jgi:DDE superfamily endonuclease